MFFKVNLTIAFNHATYNYTKLYTYSRNYLRANLFKNQADLYWRAIYDLLRFARIFFGGRPMDR